jgi:hypothetical protein
MALPLRAWWVLCEAVLISSTRQQVGNRLSSDLRLNMHSKNPIRPLWYVHADGRGCRRRLIGQQIGVLQLTGYPRWHLVADPVAAQL